MEENLLSCGGLRSGFVFLNVVKNVIYLIAVFLSFSLWLAATVNTPKRLAELEYRVISLNSAQSRTEGKVEQVLEELHFIRDYVNQR
ncbi:hypothetical protein [Candidatus Proelusimicrobium volucris]|uniref:hypothetical protein n=1 Tax=Candidatus Proelusimicrobium volucris TaxID=3416225 RepID=UPI003D0E5655